MPRLCRVPSENVAIRGVSSLSKLCPFRTCEESLHEMLHFLGVLVDLPAEVALVYLELLLDIFGDDLDGFVLELIVTDHSSNPRLDLIG